MVVSAETHGHIRLFALFLVLDPGPDICIMSVASGSRRETLSTTHIS